MWCASHIASLTVPVRVCFDWAEAATVDKATEIIKPRFLEALELSLKCWLNDPGLIGDLILRVEVPFS